MGLPDRRAGWLVGFDDRNNNFPPTLNGRSFVAKALRAHVQDGVDLDAQFSRAVPASVLLPGSSFTKTTNGPFMLAGL